MRYLLGLPETCCPDCEVLAAYIDKGLGQWERRKVERHLARCADCIALIAAVVRVLAELRRTRFAQLR